MISSRLSLLSLFVARCRERERDHKTSTRTVSTMSAPRELDSTKAPPGEEFEETEIREQVRLRSSLVCVFVKAKGSYSIACPIETIDRIRGC